MDANAGEGQHILGNISIFRSSRDLFKCLAGPCVVEIPFLSLQKITDRFNRICTGVDSKNTIQNPACVLSPA